MRLMIILFALIFLYGCTPAHPTHPTQVNCPFTAETQYTARVDRTVPAPPDPVNDPGRPDPCNTAAVFPEWWTETGILSAPICVASGTSLAEATSLCTTHLATSRITVGSPAAEVGTIGPPGGRVCPGTQIAISSLVVSVGGTPTLVAEGCREGTTWPLRP